MLTFIHLMPLLGVCAFGDDPQLSNDGKVNEDEPHSCR